MAHVFQLTDGTTTLDLMDEASYRVRQNTTLTPPPPQAITWSGSRQVDGRIPSFVSYDNREITLVAVIRGATIDALLNNLSALDLMLQETVRYYTNAGGQAKKCWLKIQLDGATNATHYNVLAGMSDPGDWASARTTASLVLFAPVRFICEPWGDEAADVSLSSTNQANSGVLITADDIRGVRETPVKFTIAVDQAVSNPRLWIARRSAGNVANWVANKMEAEAAVFTGYTTTNQNTAGWTYTEQAAAGTTSNSKFARYTRTNADNNERTARWTITSNYADHYGRYRVKIRVKANTTLSRGLYVKYGSNTTDGSWKRTEGRTCDLTTSWQIFDLGVMQWPDISLPRGVVVSTLIVQLWACIGELPGPAWLNTNVLDVDYVRLVPIDESYMEFALGEALASGDKVVVDGRSIPPAIYVTDSSGNLKTQIQPTAPITGSFPTFAPGDQRVSVYLDNQNADVLADTLDFLAEYRPRHGFMRGS